jgi:hypothetical protein
MATPEALVKAWARWATTARSSVEAPRPLLLEVLLAVSEACVAMISVRPSTSDFDLARPGPGRDTSVVICPGGNPDNPDLRASTSDKTNPAGGSVLRGKVVQLSKTWLVSKLWIGEKSDVGA